MRWYRFIGLLLLSCCCTDLAAQTRVSECRGAHGERVFSDRGDCAATAQREWTLAAPTITPPTVADVPEQDRPRRNTSGRRAASQDSRESYRCSTASTSWYQHRPCRASAGRGKQREPVKQTRVSRQQACREIDRPAALLRRGSQQDERTGPYAKATGRDPCR